MRIGKHNKKPQRHKTKEELLADLKANAEFISRMKFVKEQFYPALCEASTSVEDAIMLLHGFNSNMMESFLGFMKEKKVKDLKLEEKLAKGSDKYDDFVKLLNLFSEMSVFDAKAHIEGLKGEIEKFKTDEMQERPLSSLKTKWLDEI